MIHTPPSDDISMSCSTKATKFRRFLVSCTHTRTHSKSLPALWSTNIDFRFFGLLLLAQHRVALRTLHDKQASACRWWEPSELTPRFLGCTTPSAHTQYSRRQGRWRSKSSRILFAACFASDGAPQDEIHRSRSEVTRKVSDGWTSRTIVEQDHREVYRTNKFGTE